VSLVTQVLKVPELIEFETGSIGSAERASLRKMRLAIGPN
jgi:hypothetical protein